jgi:hypothetical protein
MDEERLWSGFLECMKALALVQVAGRSGGRPCCPVCGVVATRQTRRKISHKPRCYLGKALREAMAVAAEGVKESPAVQELIKLASAPSANQDDYDP